MDKQMLEALWIVIYSATRTATHGPVQGYVNILPTPEVEAPNMVTANMDRAVMLALQKLGDKRYT